MLLIGLVVVISVNCRILYAMRTYSVISEEILVLRFWLPGAEWRARDKAQT